MNKTYELKISKLPDEIQKPGELRDMPLEMGEKAIKSSLKSLEQVLVDTIMLKSMYKKHHWQLLGPTFYQLHLLFDKHAEEQEELADVLAERMQLLGGIAVAMPHDVAEKTTISRPPAGAESPSAMITRLMEAHRAVIKGTREGAEVSDDAKDYGTNDLFVSQVLRVNELQLWFISSHLADTKLAG